LELPLHVTHLSFQYKAYGMNLQSNIPIPGLVSSPQGWPNLYITFGLSPDLNPPREHLCEERLVYESRYPADNGEPALQIYELADGETLRLKYSDGTSFWLQQDPWRMWVTWPDCLSLESVLTYLLGPMMGLILRLRGVVCLHASAAAIDDRAVVFVGPAGAGKSTLAAGLAEQGFPVIADDIVALVDKDTVFEVAPAYPRVNLWPDSVKLLYGSEAALPAITADWDKRFLPLDSIGIAQFEERQLPVGAIYFLGETNSSAEHCEPLSRQEALLQLVANTYATNILDAQQRAKEFELLGKLVATVVVRRLVSRRGVLTLQQLCSEIRRDFLQTSKAATPI
jgi:hypothetical protein